MANGSHGGRGERLRRWGGAQRLERSYTTLTKCRRQRGAYCTCPHVFARERPTYVDLMSAIEHISSWAGVLRIAV